MALLDYLFPPQPSQVAGLLGVDEERMRQAAQRAGLLNTGLGMIAASSPSRMPQGILQPVAAGLMAGQQAYQGALTQQMQEAGAARKLREEQQFRNLMSQAAVPQYTDIPATQTAIPSEIGPAVVETPAKREITGYSYDVSRVAPQLFSMGRADVVKNIADAQKLIEGKGELTGEYANIALGLYGTSDVKKLPKDAFATISAEIERQNKAKATNIGLPSEGERRAGVLANILDKNIAQLQAAVGADPSAVKPNIAASVVKSLTGSDYLTGQLTSAQRQIVESAQLDILDAALTLRTGAAYTREQLEGYRKSYFPSLSDKEPQIREKQKRLENLLDSAYMAAGRAAPQRTTGQQAQQPAPQVGLPSMSDIDAEIARRQRKQQ